MYAGRAEGGLSGGGQDVFTPGACPLPRAGRRSDLLPHHGDEGGPARCGEDQVGGGGALAVANGDEGGKIVADLDAGSTGVIAV
ncbi:hypothetical protein STTU_4505 [Streptomyces sp. Tu6071]|nr:hypothetical protein STTU_4505 [Streptomyces sp. Tu6071]